MQYTRNMTMTKTDRDTLRSLHGRKKWEHIWACLLYTSIKAFRIAVSTPVVLRRLEGCVHLIQPCANQCRISRLCGCLLYTSAQRQDPAHRAQPLYSRPAVQPQDLPGRDDLPTWNAGCCLLYTSCQFSDLVRKKKNKSSLAAAAGAVRRKQCRRQKLKRRSPDRKSGV